MNPGEGKVHPSIIKPKKANSIPAKDSSRALPLLYGLIIWLKSCKCTGMLVHSDLAWICNIFSEITYSLWKWQEDSKEVSL